MVGKSLMGVEMNVSVVVVVVVVFGVVDVVVFAVG